MFGLPTTLYTHAAAALVAGALAAGGAYKVMDWRADADKASRLQAQADAELAAQSDARQQRRFNDRAAGEHAAQLATLNAKLGDARAHIARLSDRPCLAAGTVGLLNAINISPPGLGVRTPASGIAGAPEAAAGHSPDAAEPTGYASERDTAGAIAQCRAGYAELASQINQILDIEERRQARGK